MTSHDVVAQCRAIFAQKRVGHAGTLDPDATGVLLVGLGRATRLLQYMSGLPKAYSAEIVLGRSTTTLDSSGEGTGTWDMTGVTLGQARRAALGLTGDILQVPPMVSAVKVGGRRLHELARAGIEVERQPRQVSVRTFELAPMEPPHESGLTGPVFRSYIECSSGTFVRVLADDLGLALGGGAHVRRLRRVSVGPWKEDEAVALSELGPSKVRAPLDALPWMPLISVGAEVASSVRHGKVLALEELGVEPTAAGAGPWRVVAGDHELLAVYEQHGVGRAKPRVVLVPAG